MHRRTVRRGIFALALVTSLAFAGAQPAAAGDLGLMERLNRLWSTVTATQPGLWAQLTGWFGSSAPTKAVVSSDSTDKGWGLDPNGNTLTTTTVDGSGN